MKKIIYLFSSIILISGFFFFVSFDEYYIPKPKALIKIELPDSKTSSFEDKKISFRYSDSSYVTVKNNSYKIIYPNYFSDIYFKVKSSTDIDLELYNFENSISVHEKQGANINANIISDEGHNIFGVLCFLDGVNIATSSQFFLTDSADNFITGGLNFNRSISSEIEVQNILMKQEILKFIESLHWIDED